MRTMYFKDGEPELDSAGNIRWIEGIESLAENIDQRFQLFFGKYFMDTTQGVPYLTDILTKPVDPDFVASILNAEALKEPESESIAEVSASLDPDTRKFSYSAAINSSVGVVEVSF